MQSYAQVQLFYICLNDVAIVEPKVRVEITSVFCDVFLEAWKKGRDKKHGKECEKEVS
jgi:hypothetical protein